MCKGLQVSVCRLSQNQGDVDFPIFGIPVAALRPARCSDCCYHRWLGCGDLPQLPAIGQICGTIGSHFLRQKGIFHE